MKRSDILIVFLAINALQAAVIIIGNTITILVFWTQRSHLQRTCFLLINLAVADLLVGISEPIVLVTDKIPTLKFGPDRVQNKQSPVINVHMFASNASIFFLALISLERAFAVLWPFRHRVMSTKMYVYSYVFVLAVALCLILLQVVPLPVKNRFVYVIQVLCRCVSLLIICASYAMIRRRLCGKSAKLELHNRRVTERNQKLSKTFFIVVALSLVFWLPAFVAYTVEHYFCMGCLPTYSLPIVNILHLANSMVNPFVYAFRMPIFKVALRKFCWASGRVWRLQRKWPCMTAGPADIALSNYRGTEDTKQNQTVTSSMDRNWQKDLSQNCA